MKPARGSAEALARKAKKKAALRELHQASLEEAIKWSEDSDDLHNILMYQYA